MMHLIFYKSNDSFGRKDATRAFEPEARKLAEMFGQSKLIPINTKLFPMASRYEIVAREIRKAAKDGHEIRSLSFFCHGWRGKLQLGFVGKSGASDLAWLVTEHQIPVVNLFACSCAKPHRKGNFAQWVWEAIGTVSDCQILAHRTPGHTTRNPNISIFDTGQHGDFYSLFDKRVNRAEWLRAKAVLWRCGYEGVALPLLVNNGLRSAPLLDMLETGV